MEHVQSDVEWAYNAYTCSECRAIARCISCRKYEKRNKHSYIKGSAYLPDLHFISKDGYNNIKNLSIVWLERLMMHCNVVFIYFPGAASAYSETAWLRPPPCRL